MPRQLILACLSCLVCASEQTIIYDGSSTVYPIIIAAAERYVEVDPRFSLEAKPTGSSAGFRSMISRVSTLSGASRPISAKELKAAEEARVEFVEIPIAFDALSLVVNPRNSWLKDLTVGELQRLWSNGGPTSWKQVRATFPDMKIALFGPGSDSGTYDYFNEAVMGKDKKIRSDYTASEDDHVLVQGVAADINALGFMGMAYLLENTQTLRAVAVDNGKGAVMPTKQSVLDGAYVPLSRPIFIYLSTEHLARPDVGGFITWMLDNPGTIESVGYVPLPASMRTKVKERFMKRITGSLFSGVAVGSTLTQAMGVEAAADEAKPVAAKPAIPAPAPIPLVLPAAKPVTPVMPTAPIATWSGPSTVQYQQDIERLRAASLDLARRSLEEGATVEEIVRRSTEVKQQADALANAFKNAPRQGSGLSLSEAAALTK